MSYRIYFFRFSIKAVRSKLSVLKQRRRGALAFKGHPKKVWTKAKLLVSTHQTHLNKLTSNLLHSFGRIGHEYHEYFHDGSAAS